MMRSRRVEGRRVAMKQHFYILRFRRNVMETDIRTDYFSGFSSVLKFEKRPFVSDDFRFKRNLTSWNRLIFGFSWFCTPLQKTPNKRCKDHWITSKTMTVDVTGVRGDASTNLAFNKCCLEPFVTNENNHDSPQNITKKVPSTAGGGGGVQIINALERWSIAVYRRCVTIFWTHFVIITRDQSK